MKKKLDQIGVQRNKTVVILGGGPTLLDTLKGRKLSNPVIGVNDAFLLGRWVDICFFGDSRWYWLRKEKIRSFNGLKITCDRHSEIYGTVKDEPGVKVFKQERGYGICTKHDCIKFNRSSGAAAINLAWHLGYNRIILLGFDMRRVGGKTNWNIYPEPFCLKSFKTYDNFLEPFYKISQDAKDLGLEIINATPNSAITVFLKVDFDELDLV